ncbi:MAG: hypothetical protein DRH37_04810 [Deltaproteobacteria bacterium]|nr:MAG: hypothetical protein DRH37_04810 [Deltaproteobacteria bacterium]
MATEQTKTGYCGKCAKNSYPGLHCGNRESGSFPGSHRRPPTHTVGCGLSQGRGEDQPLAADVFVDITIQIR